VSVGELVVVVRRCVLLNLWLHVRWLPERIGYALTSLWPLFSSALLFALIARLSRREALWLLGLLVLLGMALGRHDAVGGSWAVCFEFHVYEVFLHVFRDLGHYVLRRWRNDLRRGSRHIVVVKSAWNECGSQLGLGLALLIAHGCCDAVSTLLGLAPWRGI
jgi:hypothetical protein